MTEMYGETLEYACDNADIDLDQLRFDYSGRGMYGKTCLGLVGTHKDLATFLLFVVSGEGLDDADWANVHVDNMGTDYIFYWPNIQIIETNA